MSPILMRVLSSEWTGSKDLEMPLLKMSFILLQIKFLIDRSPTYKSNTAVTHSGMISAQSVFYNRKFMAVMLSVQ